MPHPHLNIILSDHVTNILALEKRQGVCFGSGLFVLGFVWWWCFLVGFWLNFLEIKYEKKKWRAGQTQTSV